MIQRKKILYFITKSSYGGAQRYVYDLATSLPRDSFEVSVILGGSGLLKEKLNSQGIRTITLPILGRDIHPWNDIKTFFKLIKILREELPDIVHLNSSKAGILGTLAARFHNLLTTHYSLQTKIIFTAHGWAFNEMRPWWQKIIFYALHSLTVVLSHTTIAVSHATKKQIAFLPFISKKIVVIPNSIKKPIFQTRESARAYLASKNETLRFGAERLWIGTIAELHKTKGLHYAISALEILKEKMSHLAYVIMGEGEERERLERKIKELGLQKNVFLMGFVEDAARYLPAFDIFLLPSISEASPYVPLEAGLAKLPVVASRVGGLPEVITDKKSGILVEAKNPCAIASALEKLISHPQLRKNYGETLAEHIERELPFEAMLQKTIAIYESAHALEETSKNI